MSTHLRERLTPILELLEYHNKCMEGQLVLLRSLIQNEEKSPLSEEEIKKLLDGVPVILPVKRIDAIGVAQDSSFVVPTLGKPVIL